MHRSLILLLLMAPPAMAKPLPILHTLEGDRATLASSARMQALLFWRADCAPCERERATLPGLTAAHPHIPIALVLLPSEKMHHSSLPAVPGDVRMLVPSGTAEATLRQFGDTRTLLPFSVALRKDGSICARHSGLLSDDTLTAWEKRCAT